MKIGFLHLGTRIDTWARYYLWVLRRNYPQHQVVVLAEDIGSREFRFRREKCDVYLHIDDGMNYDIPSEFRPLIYICSDSHIDDGVNRKKFAAMADYSFCCQKSAVGTFGMEWLPHAAYYYPPNLKDNPQVDLLDVSSVTMLHSSNPFFAKRTALATLLKDKFKNSFIQTGPVHEKMADIYGRSFIVWNYSLNEDINMRLFEGAAAGACLVSNRLSVNKVEDVFGDLVVLYDSPDDMMQKLVHLLDHKDECLRRGRDLRRLVEPKSQSDLGHSYQARVKRVLEVAESLISKNNV